MLQLKALLSLAVVAVSFVDARPSSFDAALAHKRSPLHEHRDIHLDAPKRRHRRRALCSSRPFNVSDGPSNGNDSSSEGGEVLPDIDIQPAPEQPEEQAPPPQQPAPAPEPAPEPEPEPQPAPAPAPPPQTGIDGLAQEFLDAHNGPRAKRGAAPLTWNNELAAAAQRWANRCEFEHSGGQLGQFGENLAAGSSMTAAQGVKAWVDEEPEYNPNNPKASHFTQVVWKGSRELGCAVARCARGTVFDSFEASYYVCEYFPAGNVIGRFPENV